jgi:hypothetical protein
MPMSPEAFTKSVAENFEVIRRIAKTTGLGVK